MTVDMTQQSHDSKRDYVDHVQIDMFFVITWSSHKCILCHTKFLYICKFCFKGETRRSPRQGGVPNVWGMYGATLFLHPRCDAAPSTCWGNGKAPLLRSRRTFSSACSLPVTSQRVSKSRSLPSLSNLNIAAIWCVAGPKTAKVIVLPQNHKWNNGAKTLNPPVGDHRSLILAVLASIHVETICSEVPNIGILGFKRRWGSVVLPWFSTNKDILLRDTGHQINLSQICHPAMTWSVSIWQHS